MRFPKKWLSTFSTALLLTAAMGLAAFADTDGDEGDEVTEEVEVQEEAPEEEAVLDENAPEEAQDPEDGEDSAEDGEDLTEDGDAAAPAIESVEGDGDVQDAEETEYANHGQKVSEFAQTTDLTGCAKGQAIAAVARGGDPADAKACDEDDLEDTEEEGELDLEDAADLETEAEGSNEELTTASSDDGPAAKGKANGKANGKGKNR